MPSDSEAEAPTSDRAKLDNQDENQRERKLRSSASTPSPSIGLEAALAYRGLGDLVDRHVVPKDKVDLSYTSPRKFITQEAREAKRRMAEANLSDMLQRAGSLTTITARYILSPNFAANDSTQLPITIQQVNYLQSRQFDVEDVRLWAHILTEPDISKACAALRLGAVPGINSPGYSATNIPTFVFLSLLRRPQISADALQNILHRIWTETQSGNLVNSGLLVTRGEGPMTDVPGNQTDRSSTFILAVRLLRHARAVWPAAVVTITELFIHSMTPPRSKNEIKVARTLETIVQQANAFLRILSRPMPHHPFTSVRYQQRAQFDLVAAMASHEPPLSILREGYQAIATVQLAHKKMAQERDWSRLKSKAWPPFKVEKTGLDADKGFEYGTSRAMQAIKRAAEAGYTPMNWERSAQILAGWDIDKSPTIQTRRWVMQSYSSSLPPIDGEEPPGETLYALRIAATRTRQEAWACFLAYKDQTKGTKHGGGARVYLEMLSKLLAKDLSPNTTDGRADVDGDGLAETLEPGDHREVYPTPRSPMEATYVRTDPPSARAFAWEMVVKGIPIHGQALERLLQSAPTLERGLEYTSWGCQTDPTLGCLLSATPDAIARAERKGQFHLVNTNVYRAFLSLLCRHPSRSQPIRISSIDSKDLIWEPHHTPFAVAVRMAKARNDLRAKPLAVIANALKNKHLVFTDLGELRSNPTSRSMLHRYVFMQRLMTASLRKGQRWPPMGDFAHLCAQHLSQALLIALRVKSDAALRAREDPAHVEMVLAESAERVQEGFYAAAVGDRGPMPAISRKARGLQLAKPYLVPDGNILHTVVRILGMLRDFEAIISLFRWLQAYENDILAAAQETRNGRRLLHKTAIAARVYFERSWIELGPRVVVPTAANEEERATLMAVMAETKLFQGWPTESDVREYCRVGLEHFPPE